MPPATAWDYGDAILDCATRRNNASWWASCAVGYSDPMLLFSIMSPEFPMVLAATPTPVPTPPLAPPESSPTSGPSNAPAVKYATTTATTASRICPNTPQLWLGLGRMGAVSP